MNPPEAKISSEERAELMRLLHDSESAFLNTIEGLTLAEWEWKSAPGDWSIAETAEHLVLGEAAMLAKIEQALASAPDPEWQTQSERKAKFLGRVLPDRSTKATAPAVIAPCGGWTTGETVARYKEGRARTLCLVEQIEAAVKAHWSRHPMPVFDMLSVYHWLLYIPLHNERHN